MAFNGALVTVALLVDEDEKVEVRTWDRIPELRKASERGDLCLTRTPEGHDTLWILGQYGGCRDEDTARREHALWLNKYENQDGWENIRAFEVVLTEEGELS